MKPVLPTLAIGIALAIAFALVASARGEPLRVASLVPAASDAVRAVGPREALVATARRSLHQPVGDGVADLGNPHTPDLEALAASRPTLILADRARQARIVPADLTGRTFWLDLGTVDATLRSFDALGDALTAGEAMRAKTAAVRSQITAARSARPVRALALFGTPGQFQVITGAHWLGDLLTQLGAERVGPAEEAIASIVPLNDEVAATLRADLVVIVAHGDPRAVESALRERLATGGAWSGIASARGGIHVLDAERFGANPGLALGDAAAELSALLARAAR
jgi:ABC-type Fe3+-hydroxamate transport system substrate-binding protein